VIRNWGGRHASFDSVVAFIEGQAPAGLQTPLAEFRKLLSLDPAAVDAFDRATQRPDGNPTGHNQYTVKPDAGQDGTDNNVHGSSTIERPQGNSVQAALRRLRKDRPDLHARVLAGELSAHAAMQEAGFRRPTATVYTDDPEALVSLIGTCCTPEQAREIGARLLGYDGTVRPAGRRRRAGGRRIVEKELTPREAALAGPIDMKERGTAEWAYQWLFKLWSHWDTMRRERDLVAVILEELSAGQAWHVVPPEAPYGSLEAMVKAELKAEAGAVRAAISTVPAGPNRDDAVPLAAAGSRRSGSGEYAADVREARGLLGAPRDGDTD
jgi:hypothetical protein